MIYDLAINNMSVTLQKYLKKYCTWGTVEVGDFQNFSGNTCMFFWTYSKILHFFTHISILIYLPLFDFSAT